MPISELFNQISTSINNDDPSTSNRNLPQANVEPLSSESIRGSWRQFSERGFTTTYLSETGVEEKTWPSEVDYFFKYVWRDGHGMLFGAELRNEVHEEKHLPAACPVYVLNKHGEHIRAMSLKSQPRHLTVPVREKVHFYTRGVAKYLEQTTTVREFLCMMYDLCAVQRNMYRACKILHQGISQGNIMFVPSNEAFYKRCVDGRDEVRYINQILAKDRDVKPRPACLLVDLGLGADLRQTQADVQAREKRTGAPKFMARSVSSGKRLDFQTHLSLFAQMPALAPRALELYNFTYSKEHYDKFTELLENGSMQLAQPKASDVNFAYQLLHDAESVFWITSWLLTCSASPGYQREASWPRQLESFVYGMERHCPFDKIDTRVQILYQTSEDWEGVLHASLKSLAPMLAGMGSYVHPEWTYRTELESEPEHVHEALMRLFLNEIVRLETGDIDLAIEIRDLPEDKSPITALEATKKVARLAARKEARRKAVKDRAPLNWPEMRYGATAPEWM